jgi:uncharacterized membrane protein YfcA
VIPGFDDLPAWTLAWIAGVMLLSGFVHGVIGFGFPIVATPLLSLVLDLKAAILISVIPTLFLTVINAFRGGRLRESVGRFWYLPLCLAVGSYAGTRLLIVAPSEPFLAVLALVLLVYLNLERLGGAKAGIVRAHPAPFAVAFGFAAGVFEATVNVAGPALLVFFMLAGIPPRTLVQAFNFSFILGKGAQIATWTIAGGVTLAAWLSTLPWAIAACATLALGWRLHDRASVETYGRWLRRFMWAMAAVLAAQFARAMWSRYA